MFYEFFCDKGSNYEIANLIVNFILCICTIASLVWTIVFSTKTLQKMEIQSEEQRKQWKNEYLLRYKQEKLIEFRKQFLELKSYIDAFQRIMGPGFIGINIFNDPNKKEFLYQGYEIHSPVNPKIYLLNAINFFGDFFKFLVNEKIFLNEISWLYSDIYNFNYGVLQFLENISKNNVFDKSFDCVEGKYKSKVNYDLRFCYATATLKTAVILRDNVRLSMLHALGDNLKEKIPNIPFDKKERFVELVHNDKEFSYYNAIVNSWIELWGNTIDDILLHTATDIEMVDNKRIYCNVPVSINQPVYFKVIQEDF